MKTFFSKKKLFAVLTLFVISLLCFAIACQSNAAPFELELKSEIFRDVLYINKEYSIDKLVEKEDGAKYTFEELFYMDDNFERHDIEHTDGKFTQTKPYDVIAVVKGTKNGSSDTARTEIKINFNSNAYYDSWMTSWVDPGVVRSLSATEEYLKDGAETALQLRYLGSYNPLGDGVNFGGIAKAYADFDVTDWSNAVLTMDIYNPNNYDLQIGYQLSKDQKNYQIIMADKIVAGEWTKVNFSFRSQGYDSSFLAEGALAFKFRALGGSAPYDYTFYVCNVKVVDYSKDEFPDLETRTNLEVKQALYDSLEGDELDKQLVVNTENDSNYSLTTDTNMVYSDESQSSIKVTYYKDGYTGYPTPNRATFMLDEGIIYNAFASAIEYWDNMYLEFYLKNMTGTTFGLSLRFATKQADTDWKGSQEMYFSSYTAQAEINNISGDWVRVRFSLAEVAKAQGFEYYTENVTGLKICLCTEMARLEEGDEGVFYIDDITLYSEKSVALMQKEQYDNSTGDEIDRKLAAYTWGHTDVYKGETDTSVYYNDGKSTSSIKYTFTRDDSCTHPTVYRAAFLDDSANVLFNEYGKDITDWSTAYVGFWIKLDSTEITNASLVAKFTTTQNGVEYKGNSSLYYVAYYYSDGRPINVSFNNNWKYIEFSLANLIDANAGESYYTTDVTGFRLVLSTEIVVEEEGVPVVLYVDGLSIYNKPTSDDLDTNIMENAMYYKSGNYAVSVNTDEAYVKEGYSSLKCTFVNGSGTSAPSHLPTRGCFLYYTSDLENDIFGVTAETFTKNIYVGFWFKQESVFDDAHVNFAVRMNNYNGTTWVEQYGMDFGGYSVNKDMVNNTEWQYVEFNITELITELHKEGVTQYRISLNTEIGTAEGEPATFYIDGLSIYNESKLS